MWTRSNVSCFHIIDLVVALVGDLHSGVSDQVREHNRKLKKEAKKKGVSKRVKKDPGVPSSAPFKEEVLREAEQRRQQVMI